ncbi:MAG: ximE [Nocardia sp.]|uniref:nuclear transport factor 2 family protein n=1 Tax=Nocardia sp. TaxID=1821 RepID=UPI00261FBBA9|nr:nuclear transport factor 2 family protein [Nocardia sp.]MCU1639978.1 ximE [Nocardia sp.]
MRIGMSTPPTTVLDRYVGLADRVILDPSILETELANIFAPNASVDLHGAPVVGRAAIVDFYRRFVGAFSEVKHVWRTTVNPDGTLRAAWAASFHTIDGRVSAVAGVETAEVNADGLITSLVNEFTIPPA